MPEDKLDEMEWLCGGYTSSGLFYKLHATQRILILRGERELHAENSEERQLKIRTLWPEDFPAVPANVFQVSRLGEDFQVLFGFHDITKVATLIEKLRTSEEPEGENGVTELPAKNVASIVMGQRAFEDLVARINDIHQRYHEALEESKIEDSANQESKP